MTQTQWLKGRRRSFLSHHFSGVNSLLNFGGVRVCSWKWMLGRWFISCWGKKAYLQVLCQFQGGSNFENHCYRWYHIDIVVIVAIIVIAIIIIVVIIFIVNIVMIGVCTWIILIYGKKAGLQGSTALTGRLSATMCIQYPSGLYPKTNIWIFHLSRGPWGHQ